jgi:hypothetical protein
MKRSARLFLIALGPLATAAACGPGADPLDVDPTPSFSSVNACLAVSGTLEETFLGADIYPTTSSSSEDRLGETSWARPLRR